MDDLSLRPVNAEDFDHWLPLWKGYQAFYGVDIVDAVTVETWRRMLAPDEPVFSALAWRGSRAVGMVNWVFHRSTWTTGNYCYLQDLFVDPDSRGCSVGRRLIERVYEAAKQANCSRVYWLTHESNHPAMRLYDQVADKPGFVQYRKSLVS